MSRPRSFGTPPHAPANQSRPASSVTRPGGSRESCRGRARRGRCRAAAPRGTACRARERGGRRDDRVGRAAMLPRPTMTTTGPSRPSRASFSCPSRPRAAVRPGACVRSPWRTATACARPGAQSISGTFSSSTPRRNRRWSTGTSSSRSPPSSTIALARSRSPISARGMPRIISGGKPSPSLSVDVVAPDHALHEHRPRVGVFVGAARAADQADRGRTVLFARGADEGGSRIERLRPRHLNEFSVDAHHAVRGRVRRRESTRCRSGPCRRANRG